MEINTAPVVLPEWITREWFEQILRQYENGDESLTVKSFESTPLGAPGEHFGSITFKVSITYTTTNAGERTFKVILKTMPTVDGKQLDFLRKVPAFANETQMYAKVLPEMLRLLKKIGEEVKIMPELIYESMTADPAPVIVLEDISPAGYLTHAAPLDYDGTKVVTKTIARFHALSLFIHEEGGIDLSRFRGVNTVDSTEGSDAAALALRPLIEVLAGEMGKWSGWKHLHDKIAPNIDDIMEKIKDVYRYPDQAMIRVLNHGDFHVRNMMYKNEGTRLNDFMLIDYQFVTWNTPAIDLGYLMHTIPLFTVAQEHRKDIFKLYHSEFSDTLKKLGYTGKIISALELQIELRRSLMMELMQVICLLPFQFADFTRPDIMEVLTKDPHSLTKQGMNNTKYKEYLLDVLNKIERLGMLD